MRTITPPLVPGRVYRTGDFSEWAARPHALATRLVRDGHLVPLRYGLFHVPIPGTFGPRPPSDDALMRAFLNDTPYLFTGSPKWNALALGPTQVMAVSLVYNTQRSGMFDLGGRRFELRRCRFPHDRSPPPEWFVVDLLNNIDHLDAEPSRVLANLRRRIHVGDFSSTQLSKEAAAYASRTTKVRLDASLCAP